MKEHLRNQVPDAEARPGSPIADCHALLDDLTPVRVKHRSR
ncbi:MULTISPECIES: hypothetical protein [unclassified Streptomyces]|nr:hypothetical protein [Streptomyces sp. MnatMP-M77]